MRIEQHQSEYKVQNDVTHQQNTHIEQQQTLALVFVCSIVFVRSARLHCNSENYELFLLFNDFGFSCSDDSRTLMYLNLRFAIYIRFISFIINMA